MKKILTIVLLITLAGGLSSCEKVKGWFEVEFDTTLNADLDIEIDESAKKSTNDHEFHTSTSLSILDDDEIAEYEANIREIEVTGIVAEVKEVNKASVIFRTGTVFTVEGDNKTASWTMGNDWIIIEGTQLTLEDTGESYDLVKKILDTHGVFEVKADGFCSETGVTVVIQFSIHTTITASPL